jgi:hypothetical protein
MEESGVSASFYIPRSQNFGARYVGAHFLSRMHSRMKVVDEVLHKLQGNLSLTALWHITFAKMEIATSYANDCKAVQDYDSHSVHIDHFEMLWLQYTSEHILNHLSTVDYNMIWLWLQYNIVVVNHIIIQQSFHFDVHFGLQIMKAWWIAPLLSQFTINFWSQIRNNKIFEIFLAPLRLHAGLCCLLNTSMKFTRKIDWPQTQLHLNLE